jgi:hypothetical protein
LTLQELSKNFALDIARIDKQKAKTLEGSAGFLHSCQPQSSWDKEWNELRKRAGISHRRFHDLCHSYITRAAEAGVPLLVIQAQVGHLSTEMVAHYTHVCQEAIHHAAEQIEKNSSELLAQLGFSVDRGESLSPIAAGIQPDISSLTVGPESIEEAKN